ncbi:MAG: type 4a pilus biogenesis protein PilO [Candidatus Wildermuthbacteria bacterium]|nr:type 4a pilus biogenesis protein PilO [Candidatus Wildermuthbacteria bacterium]
MQSLNRPSFIALLFGASFIVGMFFIMPLRDDLQFFQKELKQKNFELQTSREYIENLRLIESRLRENQEAVAKLNAAIPDEPDLPLLYDFLQKLSSISGLGLKSVDAALKKSERNPQMNVISVSMSVEGPYEGIKDFLAQLKSSPRIIQLDSAGFSSPTVKNAPFAVRVTASAYSY